MIDEATRFRIIRAWLNLSKVGLAARMGVSENTIYHWETGRSSMRKPHREKFAEICHEHHIAIRPDGFPVPE